MLKAIIKECKPTKGSQYSACVDLYASEDVVIGAGETVLVPLGVKLKIDMDWYTGNRINVNPTCGQGAIDSFENFLKSHQMNLHLRSSMSAKNGLIIANGTGIIDLDYEDEIKICLHNPIKTESVMNFLREYERKKPLEAFYTEVKISKGQRIAQISLVEHKTYLLDIDTKEKRTGGFGSTE